MFDVDLQTFRRFSLLAWRVQCRKVAGWASNSSLHISQSTFTTFSPRRLKRRVLDRRPEIGPSRLGCWPLTTCLPCQPTNQMDGAVATLAAASEISEFPLIRGFTPLGVFLEHSKNRPVRYELREGYLRRLELSHEDIDKTVLAALDVKRLKDDSSILPAKKNKVVDILEDADDEDLQLENEYYCSNTDDDAEEAAMTAEDKVKRKRDEDNENDLDKHGMTTHGRCVWVNWKSSVRAKAMYWPAVALHPLHDHAVIPAAVRTSEYSKSSITITGSSCFSTVNVRAPG